MTEYEILSNKSRMKKEEFNTTLKNLGLNKDLFANIVGLEPRTVKNWGTVNQDIPHWVRSWLENYKLAIKVKKLEESFLEILSITDPETAQLVKDVQLRSSLGLEL